MFSYNHFYDVLANYFHSFFFCTVSKSISHRGLYRLAYWFITCMALILDGNSEIDAQVRSNLWFFKICFKHFIRTRIVTNSIFFLSEKTYFIYACALCSELPSNLGSMITCSPVWSTLAYLGTWKININYKQTE